MKKKQAGAAPATPEKKKLVGMPIEKALGELRRIEDEARQRRFPKVPIPLDGHGKVPKLKLDAGRPATRNDVPKWLEQKYGILALPNPLSDCDECQVDPRLLGLAEARQAVAAFLKETSRAAAKREHNRALVLFVETFRRFNQLVPQFREEQRLARERGAAVPVCRGADLPIESVLWLAWWEGHWRAGITDQEREGIREPARNYRRIRKTHAAWYTKWLTQTGAVSAAVRPA